MKSCARPGSLGDSLVCAALTFEIPDLGSRQGCLRPGELFRCGPGPARKSAGHIIATVLHYARYSIALLTDDVMMGNLVLLTGRGGEGVVWVRRGREKGAWPTDRVSEPPFSPALAALPILMFCFYLLHVVSWPPSFGEADPICTRLYFLCAPQI